MSNAIASINQKSDLISFDEEKMQVIKQTHGRNLTDAQFIHFLEVSKARGLDPLLNQIHPVVRKVKNRDGSWGSTMSIQVGIDGFRLIAHRTKEYAGQEETEFIYKNDKFPEKAKVTVYRMIQGNRVPFTATARWTEYCPGKETESFMWRKMPETMLEKCAEAKALRKAFPGDLAGLYTNEEMYQAQMKDVYSPKQEFLSDATKELEAKEETAIEPEVMADLTPVILVSCAADEIEKRKELKAMGFRWNPSLKKWLIEYSDELLSALNFEYDLDKVEL